MPDIRVVTEVAGRVCGLPFQAGASVGDGDDIAFIEAMKMEIPVLAEVSGTVVELAVTAGEQISEGDVIAVIETGGKP